jgi:hypothetical protein
MKTFLFVAWLVLLAAPTASAQPIPSTAKQTDALAAYRAAVDRFEQVLRQRRAQLKAHEALPNLPGQALYLARNSMIGAR